MTAKFIYLIFFIFDLCVYVYFDYYLEIIIMTKFYNIMQFDKEIIRLKEYQHTNECCLSCPILTN